MSDLIASEEDIKAFASQPDDQRKVTPALRGVVAEIATSATLRYPWPLLRPLLAELMEQVLVDFEADSHVEVGPAPPGGNAEEAKETRARLGQLLEGHTRGPPFTLQRLCEVLLEPRKQYFRLHKLVMALEKLLMVVSVAAAPVAQLPPRPRIADLPPVNENPPPPEAPAVGAAPRTNGPVATNASDSTGGARGGFTSAMHAAAETAFINSVFAEANPDPTSPPRDASPASPPQQPVAEPSAKPEEASDAAAAAAATAAAAAGSAAPDGDTAMAEASPTDAAAPAPSASEPLADATPAASPMQPASSMSMSDQPDAKDSAALVAASASDETKAKAASESPLTTTETAQPMES